MKKFRMLYADQYEKRNKDKKYNDMIGGFKRLETDLNSQWNQLTSLIERVNGLIKIRK